MLNSLEFLYAIYIFTIGLHLFAGVIVAAFVIPLQTKQAGVKNGLIKLRQQMLIKGLLAFVVITASVIVLSARFFVDDSEALRYAIVTLVLIHGLGVLGKSIIDYQIYHTQYSADSVEKHAQIAKREAKKSK